MRFPKVHVEHDFLRDGFRIWFYEQLHSGGLVYRLKSHDEWETVEVKNGAEWGEPSLYLHAEALGALVRAAEGHVHAQDATVRHLDDATATRDRLLTLIEKRGLR